MKKLAFPILPSVAATLKNWAAQLNNAGFSDPEAGWLQWEPSLVGSGGLTLSSQQVLVAQYQLAGDMINGFVKMSFTGAGAPATPITISLPKPLAGVSPTRSFIVGLGFYWSGAGWVSVIGSLSGKSTSATLWCMDSSAPFTTGASQEVTLNFSYRWR